MSTHTVDTSSDLDFLTADFTDLPVAAAYRIPPSGVYTLGVSAKFGQSKANKPMIVVEYDVKEIISVANASEEKDVVIEDKFNSYLSWGNEWGMKALQEFLKPYVAHFQTGRLQELIVSDNNPDAMIKDLTIVATLKRTPRKDKDTKQIIDGEYNFSFTEVTIA